MTDLVPDHTHRLKCRYCDFTIGAWRTTRSGEKRSGMSILVQHVRDTHTPTYELERIVSEEDEDAA